VLSVDEKDGIIIHTVNKSLKTGEKVRGEIDFELRFRKMQDHTAEHIVSGIIHRLFGYDNVGFHLGEGYMTADFNGELCESDVERVESLANKAVFECHRVNAYYPNASELSTLQYRSKLDLSENVRIVEIEGVDMCACCAPHVENTGEVGLIKIVEAIRYKGGMRLTMIAGYDALADYRAKETEVRRISMAISAKQSEVSRGVERLLGEIDEMKAKMSALKRENMQMKLDFLDETDDSIILFEESDDMLAMRNFVNGAVKKTKKLCAVFAGDDVKGYKYIIASESMPLRGLSKEISATLGGKGGGSDAMIQGSVSATRDQIEIFFR
jgi:alanyl-tRNA synthetase